MQRDAIQILTDDHREVEGLFQKVESGSAGKKDVVAKIVRELSIHDAIEREYLYPAVRKHIADQGDHLAEHSLDEHGKVATLLADIEDADDAVRQDELLRELIPDVKSHVKEEEEQIFPGLRSAMSASDLADLGSKLEKAKGKAPTHPHPHAPRSGVGAKIAGTAAATMDKVRDAAADRR